MGWSTAPVDHVALTALETGYTAGVRLFDTADVYGHGRSERLVGELVAQVPRGDIVLVSKVGYFTGTAKHGYSPGHMRRQLEQTLENLRTDHLDIYFLHHNEFGPEDRWLPGAVEAMRTFQGEGLIRAVGMRGPHRFAPERLHANPGIRSDKVTRFRELFEVVRPQVLAVRDNLLTPAERSTGLFEFATHHQVGVLINKVLGQGLLAGAADVENEILDGPRRLAGTSRRHHDPLALRPEDPPGEIDRPARGNADERERLPHIARLGEGDEQGLVVMCAVLRDDGELDDAVGVEPESGAR